MLVAILALLPSIAFLISNEIAIAGIELICLSLIFGRLVLYALTSRRFSLRGLSSGFLCGLIIFVCWVFIVSLYRGSYDFSNVYAMLRYVVLVPYIAIFYNFSKFDRLCQLFVILAVINCSVVLLQFVGLLPYSLYFERVGVLEGPRGLMRDHLVLCGSLTVGLVVICSRSLGFSRHGALIIAILLVFSVFISGSRTFFLVSVISFAYLYLNWGTFKIILVSMASIALVLILGWDLGDNNKNFFFVFSSQYILVAMQQRLGLLIDLAPALFSMDFVVGLSADRDIAIGQLFQLVDFKNVFFDDVGKVLEDVYSLALIVYYGLIGLILFVITFFYQGLAIVRRFDGSYVSKAAIVLFFIVIVSSLFSPSFEVRTLSLGMWTFVAGQRLRSGEA